MENYNNQYSHASSDIIIKDIISVTHDIRTNPWKHTHKPSQGFEIHFTLRGRSQIARDDIFINETNNFSYITPYSFYASNSLTVPTEVIGVFFHAELPDNIKNNIFHSNLNIPGCNDTVRNSFKNIKHIYYSRQNNYQLKIKKEIYNILSTAADILTNVKLEKSGYYILKAADEYIKENYYRETISVEEVAGICKITPAYFCRIFKEFFGISPKKRIIDLKMQTAGEYLTFTSTPISEIAKSVGYNELSYFTTAFKNYFGVTPSEYRNR